MGDKERKFAVHYEFDPAALANVLRSEEQDVWVEFLERDPWPGQQTNPGQGALQTYMSNLKEDLFSGSEEKLDRINSGSFVGMCCHALVRNWRCVNLKNAALTNVYLVAQSANNSVHIRSLVNRDVLLASILSMSYPIAQGFQFSPEIEYGLKTVLSIIYETENWNSGNSGSFTDPDILEAFMIVMPRIFDYLNHQSEYLEEASFIMRNMLVDLQVYDRGSRELVIYRLAKHGFINETLDYFHQYPYCRGEMADCCHLKRFTECLNLLLKLNFKLDDESLLPMVHELVNVLSCTNISVLGNGYEDSNVVLFVINNLIENIENTAINQMGKEFFDNLIESLNVNREIMSEITQTTVKAMKKLQPIGLSLSPSNHEYLNRSLVYSTLKHISMKIEALLDPREKALSVNYCKLYCVSVSTRNPEEKDKESNSRDNDLLMFLTNMKLFMIILNSEDLGDFDSTDECVTSFVRYPYTVVEQMREKSNGVEFKSMVKIIEDNLPDIAAMFEGQCRMEYTHFVTLLVLSALDEIDDFLSSRWEQIRYTMFSYYVNITHCHNNQVHSTRLLFMWKLFNLSIHGENSGAHEQHSGGFVSDLILFELYERDPDTDLESCSIVEICELFYGYIVHDIQRVLRDPSLLHCVNSHAEPVLHVVEITELMVDMALNICWDYQVTLLGDIVPSALDVTSEYRCNFKLRENVDKFIRNLYINKS